MRGWFVLTFLALLSAALTGCNARPGPQMLTIAPDQYDQAFAAAVEVARRDGLQAAFQDRRAGVIETEPRRAASMFEPWRTDNATTDQAVENTLGLQRRRARFEFVPVGFQDVGPPPGSPPAGPDLLGIDAPTVDLTQTDQPLELRVWVFTERAHTPGMRRSSWTRRKTTRSILVYPENEAGLPSGQFWTPLSRDEAYEQRLLAGVQRMLTSAPEAVVEPAAEPADPSR